jgi:acetylornithine/succinyldiaminopimelate/putrescine aminotransferase/acyl carrier protein
MTRRTRDEIRSWVVAYAERELGVERGSVRGELDLAAAGVDSLEAVTLVAALEGWLGKSLPPTLLWDCRTLESFLDDVANVTDGAAVAGERGEPGVKAKHDFTRYVNPYLGRKIEQLKIDKRFVRGDGCHLYDDAGERYVDFLAQYGALPFGYNPPEIWAALVAARDRGEPSFVQPSPLDAAAELARRLLAIAPENLRYVTFTNSGAESVEAAIKLCRNRTRRRGVLSTKHGFHGKTMGALSATGKAAYQRPFGLPAADFDCIPYGDLGALEEALHAKPGFYAAFVVEPIQGEGGIVVPPRDYLREAHVLCRRTGTLLVADEVQTGLGRTGVMFASQAAGVLPDVVTLAKALGGGLVPIGACLASADVYTKKFGLKHSSTFAGNALGARAGLATLDLLERDDRALLRAVTANGARFKARLEAIRARHPQLVAEIRGEGYMLGVRLGVERSLWPESFLGVAADERELAQLVSAYLLNVERVRVAPTLNADDVLRIEPPLIATAEQCDHVAAAVERAFDVLASGDTARFYGSLLDRAPRPAASRKVVPLRRPNAAPAPAPGPGDARFAFLMHPLDAQTFVDYDPTLASLSGAELAELVDTLDGTIDPFVGSEVRIVSRTGAAAHGTFILVSRTAESLMAMPEDEAMDEIRDALERAKQHGAQIVGLGAYVSVVTRGGLKLSNEGVPITSGNSYTVVSALDGLDVALEKARRGWTGACAAVVGAGGAIGRVCAALLA